MFYRSIVLVCFVGIFNVNAVYSNEDYVTTAITFNLHVSNVSNELTCDHKNNEPLNNYTALENENIKIIVNYTNFVNFISCADNKDTIFNNITSKKGIRGNASFKVDKRMGTQWTCTILTLRNTPYIKPVVNYEGDSYTASYCYMKIHVRQTAAPQTILVNNMALTAVRTDLSNDYTDFTAEYHYVDGDVVNVLCANLNEKALLKMEYDKANNIIDEYNSSYHNHLSSNRAIGFTTTLRSGDNNTHMICTQYNTNDYSISKVTFVMQKDFNFVSVKINGMTMRPILKESSNNLYKIDYKYISEQDIEVVCEVNRTDIKFTLPENDFVTIKDLGIANKAVMWFRLKRTDDKTLMCSSDYASNSSIAQMIEIHFTAADNLLEIHNLHMDIPSDGKVMELFNHGKLKVIFYEFEEGDTLKLNCSTRPNGQIVQRLGFKDPGFSPINVTPTTNSAVKTLNVTAKDDNTNITCYLKEAGDEDEPSIQDKILYEIILILHKRDLTTTTTTTTENPADITGVLTSDAPRADSTSADGKGSDVAPETQHASETMPMMGMIAGVIVCIIIICVSIVIIKLRKRNQSENGPHVRDYSNLQTPSDTTIPPYPPQWECNYAVPVDRRTDDTTYSVPCTEPALYSVPTPKNQRIKKPAAEPTYAILNLKNPGSQKNKFKEADDPNYSEVYANRNEQCYAKVLPKSMRDKMEENPYSTVNEPSYANTEPMYCEPSTAGRAQGGQYANINNTSYANTNTPEYVEPTYCEPQKRMK